MSINDRSTTHYPFVHSVSMAGAGVSLTGCGGGASGEDQTLMAGAWRNIRRVIAIGAGSGIGSDTGSGTGTNMDSVHATVEKERSGRQRNEVIVMTRSRILNDGGQRMCANTCPTPIRTRESTRRTRVNG